MAETMKPLYQSRADYIAVLIDDVEQIVAEEIPNAGRAQRRRGRKIAEIQAKKGITVALWEAELKGDAEMQEYYAVEFLRAARKALVMAMDEMSMR